MDENKNKEAAEKENWLDEHGQPDFNYLQSLAVDGSPGALEKLHSIADDLNVEYDPDIASDELIKRIMSAVSRDGDSGPDGVS